MVASASSNVATAPIRPSRCSTTIIASCTFSRPAVSRTTASTRSKRAYPSLRAAGSVRPARRGGTERNEIRFEPQRRALRESTAQSRERLSDEEVHEDRFGTSRTEPSHDVPRVGGAAVVVVGQPDEHVRVEDDLLKIRRHADNPPRHRRPRGRGRSGSRLRPKRRPRERDGELLRQPRRRLPAFRFQGAPRALPRCARAPPRSAAQRCLCRPYGRGYQQRGALASCARQQARRCAVCVEPRIVSRLEKGSKRWRQRPEIAR